MPIHEEEQNKKLQLQQNETIAKQKAMSQELKIMTDIKPTPGLKKQKKRGEVSFFPVIETKRSKDWVLILADYKIKYGLLPDEKTGALVFLSREEAVEFFKAQTKAGREFFTAEHIDGKPSGFYLLSCGDGELYQGTLDEINAGLEAAIKKDPTNKKALESLASLRQFISGNDLVSKKTTQRMRENLQDTRVEEPMKAPSPALKN